MKVLSLAFATVLFTSTLTLAETSHTPQAVFHPHGNTLCASGCALSRHPTPPLSRERFEALLDEYAGQPMTQESEALEELLFYGPQTKRLLESTSTFTLDDRRLDFLREELDRDLITVEFRLVDRDGRVRVSLPPTTVPFDRRYVFEPLLTEGFQPPEASGTVKRVGLRHIWQRI